LLFLVKSWAAGQPCSWAESRALWSPPAIDMCAPKSGMRSPFLVGARSHLRGGRVSVVPRGGRGGPPVGGLDHPPDTEVVARLVAVACRPGLPRGELLPGVLGVAVPGVEVATLPVVVPASLVRVLKLGD